MYILSSPTVTVRIAKDLQLPKVSSVYPLSVAVIQPYDHKQLKEEIVSFDFLFKKIKPILLETLWWSS